MDSLLRAIEIKNNHSFSDKIMQAGKHITKRSSRVGISYQVANLPKAGIDINEEDKEPQ